MSHAKKYHVMCNAGKVPWHMKSSAKIWKITLVELYLVQPNSESVAETQCRASCICCYSFL